MALITCKECGKEHSEFADKCPNCGFPSDKRIGEKEPEIDLKPESDSKPENDSKSTENKVKSKNGCMGCLGFGVIAIIILAIIGSFLPDSDENDSFDEVSVKVYCGDLIQKSLNDPGSYKFESMRIISRNPEANPIGKAVIIFRAKNKFGGYVKDMANCEAYKVDKKVKYKINFP